MSHHRMNGGLHQQYQMYGKVKTTSLPASASFITISSFRNVEGARQRSVTKRRHVGAPAINRQSFAPSYFFNIHFALSKCLDHHGLPQVCGVCLPWYDLCLFTRVLFPVERFRGGTPYERGKEISRQGRDRNRSVQGHRRRHREGDGRRGSVGRRQLFVEQEGR